MEKFRRIRVSQDEPVISIRDNRFYYSATFTKMAELKEKKFVRYYLDEKKMEICFEFLSEKEDDHCYKLGNENNKKNNFRSSAGELISHYPRVKRIHNSRDNELKKFFATKAGNFWTIKLRPCFENGLNRKDIDNLANNLSGIYRYLNSSDEIVYIGQGNIKQRIKAQERSEWVFDKIEYSIIEKKNERYYWESYWIERHKEQNNGQLPYYNLLSGNGKIIGKKK
jgi:hypothetical protein